MKRAPAAAIRISTVEVHGVAADTSRSGPLSGVHTSVCGITADDWSLIDYADYPAPGLRICEGCLAHSANGEPK